jgi:hypothetical protein
MYKFYFEAIYLFMMIEYSSHQASNTAVGVKLDLIGGIFLTNIFDQIWCEKSLWQGQALCCN